MRPRSSLRYPNSTARLRPRPKAIAMVLAGEREQRSFIGRSALRARDQGAIPTDRLSHYRFRAGNTFNGVDERAAVSV